MASISIIFLLQGVKKNSYIMLCLLYAPKQVDISAYRNSSSNLRKHVAVLEQIGSQERNIISVQQAVFDKEAPLRVAQSRLHFRAQRPNMELCRDQPQISLLGEVEQISHSLCVLQQQQCEARDSLARLEENRMLLEKDIGCKTHSLFIDQEKCMKHRLLYPSMLALSGY